MQLIVLFNRDVWALEQQAPEAAARLRPEGKAWVRIYEGDEAIVRGSGIER